MDDDDDDEGDAVDDQPSGCAAMRILERRICSLNREERKNAVTSVKTMTAWRIAHPRSCEGTMIEQIALTSRWGPKVQCATALALVLGARSILAGGRRRPLPTI